MNNVRNFNTYYHRKRSQSDKALEEMYQDWYGCDRAMFEIESAQQSARKVGDVIGELLISMDKGDHVLLREIIGRWEEFVGPQIQYQASPRRIKNKVLFIEVHAPSWRFHLERNLKPEIKSLIQQASNNRILDIQFITGGKTKRQYYTAKNSNR